MYVDQSMVWCIMDQQTACMGYTHSSEYEYDLIDDDKPLAVTVTNTCIYTCTWLYPYGTYSSMHVLYTHLVDCWHMYSGIACILNTTSFSAGI